MEKAYNRIVWQNQPSTATALGATNLNKMDNAINTIDDRVVTMDTTKANQSTVNNVVQTITYNESNGVLSITKVNGTITNIDTKLEKLAVNFTYDSENQQLIIALDDGTTQSVDLSSLISEYEFEDSESIGFTLVDGTVRANVINGSITQDKLQPDYLADITIQANIATNQANLSKRYAVGGVEVGDEIDNAMYYKEQAEMAKQAAEQARDEAESIVGVGIATESSIGLVKGGGNVIVNPDGTMNVDSFEYITIGTRLDGSIVGRVSTAEGDAQTASGEASHAEGTTNISSGVASHAEGAFTESTGNQSHTEGNGTKATGNQSHAEGSGTLASGNISHAEGKFTEALYCAHAEGNSTKATGDQSHSEGHSTIASGYASHAEGANSIASGSYAHAEGSGVNASGNVSHAEGNATIAKGAQSHAEGFQTKAYAHNSHAEGAYTQAGASNTDAFQGQYAHAEGHSSRAFGDYSHAEGYNCEANKHGAHAEGYQTTASGAVAHSEGQFTVASGDYSHAEGQNTTASGTKSHAEGYNSQATNSNAHSEGANTVASGANSHAEGDSTTASGNNSHAAGQGTKAIGTAQTVVGRYNATHSTDLFQVGMGTSDAARSTALRITSDGQGIYKGDVKCNDGVVSLSEMGAFNAGRQDNSSTATSFSIPIPNTGSTDGVYLLSIFIANANSGLYLVSKSNNSILNVVPIATPTGYTSMSVSGLTLTLNFNAGTYKKWALTRLTN